MDGLWADMESYAAPGVRRSDPKTWTNRCFPSIHGLTPSLAQSAGAWIVRGAPGVKAVFARIWGTPKLLVSMDCVILWRPWLHEPGDGKGKGAVKEGALFRRPRTEGLHLDQNPFTKPGLECVQGMVPLLEVTAATGGLEVVPRSHTAAAKASWKREHAHLKGSGDWCPLAVGSSLGKGRKLILAEPGDLVLWDSRTIHGGVVGSGLTTAHLTPPDVSLARLSVTVSMTAASRASPEVRKIRREGFKMGRNFNHTPHEAGTSTGTIQGPIFKGFTPPALTRSQLELLG